MGSTGDRNRCRRHRFNSIFYTILRYCHTAHPGYSDPGSDNHSDEHLRPAAHSHPGPANRDEHPAAIGYTDPHANRDAAANGYRDAQPTALHSTDGNDPAAIGNAMTLRVKEKVYD